MKRLFSSLLAALMLATCIAQPVEARYISQQGGGVPLAKLGFVATGGELPQNSNVTNKQMMARSFHVATTAINAAQLVFPNFVGQKEVGIGASATVTASIEYPANTFTQVTFGGSTSGTISNGGLLFSDMMTLGTQIPQGAIFWVRAYYTSTAGILYETNGLITSGYDSSVFGVSGISDLTVTSGAVGTASINTYKPAAIIGLTTNKSVLIMGDSRVYGYQDTTDTTGLQGYARLIGRYSGFANVGANGDEVKWFLSNGAQRMKLVPYATHILTDYGVNDVMIEQSSVATILAEWQTFIGLMGNTPVYWGTMEPESTSTDNWATLIGQTTSSFNSGRVTLNDDLRQGKVSGIAGYVEVADTVESARDSGLWAVNGSANWLTPDGIHPNQTGQYLERDSLTDFAANGKAAQPTTGGAVNGNETVQGSLIVMGASNSRAVLPVIAGHYYGLPPGASLAAVLTQTGLLYAYPFYVPNAAVMTSLHISVTTGQTGGACHAGVYADNGAGYPGALVYDSGALSATGTSVPGTTGLAVNLTPGFYWGATICTASTTFPSVAGQSAVYTNAASNWLGYTSAANALAGSATAMTGLYSGSQTYGALPGTFPALTAYITNATTPVITIGF